MATLGSSSAPRLLISIDDFTDPDAAAILSRASDFATAGRAVHATLPPFTLGLFFLQPSLRTRVGFCAAALRLGGEVIEIPSLRSGPGMSEAERFVDAVRVASGMVDLLATRTPFQLDRDELAARCVCPLVNGGDAAAHHPSQTLIDLFAIERFGGPLSELHLALCGDLQARPARSLLAWLARHPPRRLRLIAPPTRRSHGVALGAALTQVTEVCERLELGEVDVLYMIGLAEGSGADRLGPEARAPYRLGADGLRQLPSHAIVLSPMPVVDEIDRVALADARVRIFAQSDLGVPVRMAVLDHLLRSAH